LVVDLAWVTRLVAVALGGLFYANGQPAKRGVAIGFVIPRGTGQVVFDVHGLEQRLPLYEVAWRGGASHRRRVTGEWQPAGLAVVTRTGYAAGVAGESDHDRLEDAYAVLGEFGYALELEPTLAGWDALVYPMEDLSALGEFVAHASTEVEAAELAVAYMQSRVLRTSRATRG
jgi:hypothetical protein